MSALNTAMLASRLTDLAASAHDVRQDPAVVKAARAAWGDTVIATRSIGTLAVEVNTSWRRHRRPSDPRAGRPNHW